ncbi:ATP-binding protein [Maribacter chungangensis]|uniref:histidine kinase n=1 Tax=Maribacter chungangensis TaxID=1069117 RepID=A0ABW3B034_9FLAO
MYLVLVLVTGFYCISQQRLLAQDIVNFKAFGHTPSLIKDSLYVALNNVDSPERQLPVLYAIGEEHKNYGNADSVVHYAQRMANIPNTYSEFVMPPLYEARAQLLLGEGKYLNGLYDSALEAFLTGLSVVDEPKNEAIVRRLQLGLGKVYLQKHRYGKAEAMFQEVALIADDASLKAKAKLFLGRSFFQQGDLVAAARYYDEAQGSLDEKSGTKLKLEVRLAMAELALKQKNYTISLPLYEEIIRTGLEENYFDVYTVAVQGYGTAQRELGNFEVAEMTLSTAYANAMQWNRLDLQKKIVNSLRLTYSAKGDFENAYNLMTQFTAISNEIIAQQNSKAIQELEIKYQTLQKENEIYELKEEQAEKQNEIERQKTIKKAVLIGFLALLIPIIALLYVYYQKLQAQSALNKQQEELNAQRISGLLNEQELKLARTSLEAQQEERARIAQQLHDSIGGNLAGIKLQMANMEDKNKLQKGIMNQINETYELVREISHDLTPKKFNESAFTLLIAEYVEKIKNSSKMEVTFQAHPKERINNLGEPLKVVLYQVVQELFTNTIKHANAKQVELHLTVHKNVFQLLFEDDGAGFEVKNTPNGIGLYNIKNRIEQWNGSLLVDSALGRGTVVTIEIPIKHKHENI